MGFFDSIEEDIKLMDEATRFLPEEREEFLKWHGRSKEEFPGLYFGEDNSDDEDSFDDDMENDFDDDF